MSSNYKLVDKKIELKKALFTIDSILCVKKEATTINNNDKESEFFKLSNENSQVLNIENKKYSNVQNIEEFNDSFSNDINSEDFSKKYCLNYTNPRRSSDENSNGSILFKNQNKHNTVNLHLKQENVPHANRRSIISYNNLDLNKKNIIFPSTYSEDFATNDSHKNINCSKQINDSSNCFNHAGSTLQCIIQTNSHESIYHQKGFSNNFQYCLPGLITTTGQNFTSYQNNSFMNYNQFLAINSGKNKNKIFF